MIAYTDYPLCESALIFGKALDEPGREAPIREVVVHFWDGDKYGYVGFQGSLYSFKVGYLYEAPGRCGDVSPIDWNLLPVEEAGGLSSLISSLEGL